MHNETKLEFNEFKKFAETISESVGLIAVEKFDTDYKSWNKTDGTIVTEVDIFIEEVLRAKIKESYPTHSITGEEGKDLKTNSPYTWILDPLDGTLNFSFGIPFYGILIGLSYNNKMMYGSYRLPSYGNIFCAGGEQNFYANGFNTSSKSSVSLNNSLVLTTDENRILRSEYYEAWKALNHCGPVVRTWGDCFGYHMIISGKADIMFDIGLKACDILPIVPILESCNLSVIWLNPPLFEDIVVCKKELEKDVRKLFKL